MKKFHGLLLFHGFYFRNKIVSAPCLSLFQMVFVSLGAPRRERKGEGVQLPASCLPPPQKDNIPMLLLLQEPHLTTLFDLLEMLASFKPPSGEVAMEDSEVI